MKRTVVMASAIVLALGATAQAQTKQPYSGSPLRTTVNGVNSKAAPSQPAASAPTSAPTVGGSISATAGGSTSVANPSPPTSNSAWVNVDISGVQSWDSFGSPNNTLMVNGDGGAGKLMTGIGWDVTIATVGSSWLSEPVIYFDGSDLDGSGLFLTPGAADGFPGTASYSSGGPIDLTDNGIPDIPVLADGLIHMEFFESFDDVSNAVDADFLAGSSLTLLYNQIGVDISGVQSWDSFGSPNNTVLTNDSGGMGSVMTGIGWDVTIATIGASWLSEPVIYFDGSDQDGSGLFLTPGAADGFPGTASYSSGGIVDLTDNGIPDVPVLADGLIHMEFFESFDDVSNAADADFLAPSRLDLVYATCGSVTDLGGGCAGNGGFIPAASATGCMSVGDTVNLSVSDMDGGRPHWLVTGLTYPNPNFTFANGCTLDVADDHVLFLGNTPGAGAGAGAESFDVNLPVAAHLFLQFVVSDSVVGMVTSNTIEIEINP